MSETTGSQDNQETRPTHTVSAQSEIYNPKSTIEITRTELVWPGKYNPDGTRKEVPRVSLPFQVIETVNESRATRETEKREGKSLFDFYQGKEGDTFEAGWKNKLIWGDNLLVMGSLLENFAGKIDLIYIDPPFATGTDFSVTTRVGDDDLPVTKEQSLIEEKAYRDTWGRGIDSYLQMISERLTLMKELLSERGSIYVHCDWRVNSHLRLLLDDTLGAERFRNQVIWKRTGARSGTVGYNIIDDSILFYSRTGSCTWNTQYTPYTDEYVKAFFRGTDADGKRFQGVSLMAPGTRKGSSGRPWRGVDPTTRGRHWAVPKYIRTILSEPGTEDVIAALEELDTKGRILWPDKEGGVPRFKQYISDMEGVELQSVWTDIAPIGAQALEDTRYATQKPEALLERIIKSSSNDGDLVADFFCGSGTTLAVAEKLGRRWIGCDLGRYAVHTARKRLLEIDGCRPFEILNLGRYERQYWQGVTFGGKGKTITEQALYEYLAFILKLYGGQPVPGLIHLHGKKGRAMVHIGAVDAPVTIDEINAAIAECAQLKQPELHVLGWEWEMGLYDLMEAEAKRQGVKLLLLSIPREVMEQQAVEQGHIQFFELAYLEAKIEVKKLTATVTLKDFVIPNTELIPEEVRSKIKKWSDYIDYWAVDWDFQSDTFMQGWVTYRTRKDRSLALSSDSHSYPKAGKYRLLVKVVDIFGNDTTQAFEVEVK
jgi:DNA modification methylase